MNFTWNFMLASSPYNLSLCHKRMWPKFLLQYKYSDGKRKVRYIRVYQVSQVAPCLQTSGVHGREIAGSPVSLSLCLCFSLSLSPCFVRIRSGYITIDVVPQVCFIFHMLQTCSYDTEDWSWQYESNLMAQKCLGLQIQRF